MSGQPANYLLSFNCNCWSDIYKTCRDDAPCSDGFKGWHMFFSCLVKCTLEDALEEVEGHTIPTLAKLRLPHTLHGTVEISKFSRLVTSSLTQRLNILHPDRRFNVQTGFTNNHKPADPGLLCCCVWDGRSYRMTNKNTFFLCWQKKPPWLKVDIWFGQSWKQIPFRLLQSNFFCYGLNDTKNKTGKTFTFWLSSPWQAKKLWCVCSSGVIWPSL